MRRQVFRCWLGPDWHTYNFNLRIGAAFSPPAGWTELKDDNGSVTIDMTLMDNFAAYSWTMRLSGFNAREQDFSPDKLVLVEAGDSASVMRIMAIGIIETVATSADARRMDEWSIQLVSVADRLSKHQLRPFRIGPLDVAQNGTVTTSSSLAKSWKETRRHANVSSPQTDYTGQHTIDDDPDTQWISDSWVGDGPYNTNQHTYISMVSPVQPPDVVSGCRFIEFINADPNPVPYLLIWNDDTKSWAGAETDFLKNLVTSEANDPWMGRAYERRFLLVQNKSVFDRYWPTADQAWQVIDMSTQSSATDRLIMENMRPHKGIVAIRSEVGSGQRACIDYVAWGPWTEPEWRDAELKAAADPGPNMNLAAWANTPGYIVAKPDFHQVIKKDLTQPKPGKTNSPAPGLYTLSWIQNVGWIIQPQDMKGADFEAAPENWMVLSLPEMGHVLARDLKPGDTKIYVEDQTGEPWTEGWPATGHVFIDDEFIRYVNRDFDQGTLDVFSPIVHDHFAGASVLLQHKVVDGQWKVSGAWPLIDTGWKNKEYPAPRDFMMRWSYQDTARTPGESEHERTYDVASSTMNHTGLSWNTGHVPSMRAHKIALEIGRMNGPGGTNAAERPRIGTLYAHADRQFFDTRYWLNEAPNESLIMSMLLQAGIPSSAITVQPGTLIRSSGVTDAESAWYVITDAAQYGDSFVAVDLDNHITIRSHTALTGSWSQTQSYNMTTMTGLRIDQVRDRELGQVKLVWELPDGSAGGETYYPATKDPALGQLQQGPQLFESAGAALTAAQRVYQVNRYPHGIFAEFAHAPTNIRPGDIHRLAWSYESNTRVVTAMVNSVEITIENMTLSVRAEYRELSR